jgi:uncharacterized membrane protein
VIVLGGALFLVYLAVMVVRRMALGLGKTRQVDPMEDLSRLYEQGKISQEEYERGRRKILSSTFGPTPPTGNR